MRIDYLLIFILLFFICSCTNRKTGSENNKLATDSTFADIIVVNKANEISKNLDSIKQVILSENNSSADAIKYKFSIADIGTESNEGTAYYNKNKLHKIEFDIFTSMWKIHLQYIFYQKYIKVTEETFNVYENVKQVKEISYKINLEGVPIEQVDSTKVDVFQKIKEVVPFKLN